MEEQLGQVQKLFQVRTGNKVALQREVLLVLELEALKSATDGPSVSKEKPILVEEYAAVVHSSHLERMKLPLVTGYSVKLMVLSETVLDLVKRA